MTDYVLQITLQSSLTSAAGEGRVGLVDRDVAFDEVGLPILPGRRLKGLWREAYRDVAEAWALNRQSSIPVDQIFGEPGQKPGDGDASLYIANAELQEAPSLKPWLAYLQHHKIQKLHPDDIVQHFADIRTQTAIDRQTGAARENTLRLTRTLQAGLVFRAPLRFVEPPDEALLKALSLGAAALQHIGTARTRGLGKVCCRLLARDAGGQECDLTGQALSNDALPSITANSPAQPSQTPKKQTVSSPRSNSPTPTHLLRYRLTLTAPAVIPVADGDPNTVMTRQDVPGGHILGVAAWHYLRQSGHTPTDKEFHHAFLDGGLRFLTAYPEADDPEVFDETQRMIPIPHSIRKLKNDDHLVDFVEQSTEEQTQRLDRRYAKIEQWSLKTQAVKTERNYHHARAGDRRKGRALGAEVADGGAFFMYEAICAGQSFQGAVLGSDIDLKALQTWLQGVNSIGIGRSRSAQYGEAKFEWIDETPLALNKMPSEWDGFVDQCPSKIMPPVLDNRLIITTLSPLLTVNDQGHSEARFPERELAEALGLDTASATKLKLSHSYTRTELVGGYHTHLRLPRQQWPAIAAGSVFVFDMQRAPRQGVLFLLEHDGLGLRKGEGMGRIAVNRQGSLELTGKKETPLDDPERLDIPEAPDSKIPRDILRGVVRTRCLAEMQQRAMLISKQIPSKNFPSNSLLGRLRLFFQQDSPVESLKKLRDPAKEQLSDYRIDTRDLSGLPNQITLHQLFEKAWTAPESLTQELITERVQELVKDHDSDMCQAMVAELVRDDSTTMCTVFLDHLLTALHRRQRI